MLRRRLDGTPDSDVRDASGLPPDTYAFSNLQAGADRFIGSSLDDVAYGGTGDDTLAGGAGADILRGEDGDDALRGEDGDDRLLGGVGNDLLLGGAGVDRLDGAEGEDTLDGGDGDDVIRAGAGNDRLVGGLGNDRLVADDGDDRIIAGEGDDTAAGGEGGDVLLGEGGADRLLGEGGNDTLDGGAGVDTVFGGDGDDVVSHTVADRGATFDRLDGGAGTDTLRLAFTRAEWLDADNQAEFGLIRAAAATGGEARSPRLGLSISGFEALKVTVDGVTVTAADDPVTARNDLLAVTAGGSVSADLLANDTVPDLNAGAQLYGVSPTRGIATLTAEGVLTFDTGNAFAFLGAGVTQDVAVGYRVRDADGDFGTATATVRVTGVNDAPTGVVLSTTRVTEGAAPEGGRYIGALTALDPDGGDTFTFTVDDARFEVQGNALFLREGETLDAGTEPSVALTLSVTDAAGLSASSTATLSVREPGAGFDIETVGTYEFAAGAGIARLNATVQGAGLTAVTLNTLSAAELAGVDAIFATNNYGDETEFVGAGDRIEAWVRGGGILFLHDRAPNGTFASDRIPGGETMTFVQITGTASSRQIEVVDDGGPVATGPFGAVTDTSLDGGNESNHGHVVRGTLPADAVVILTDGNPAHAVTFAYALGEGAVVYSTVPLDYYLEGNVSPVYAAMQVYAKNLLAAFTDGGDLFG